MMETGQGYCPYCGNLKGYIVINSGPIATFSADNMVLDIKDPSIREIQPPINLIVTSESQLNG
jgi:hypothetical protein